MKKYMLAAAVLYLFMMVGCAPVDDNLVQPRLDSYHISLEKGKIIDADPVSGELIIEVNDLWYKTSNKVYCKYYEKDDEVDVVIKKEKFYNSMDIKYSFVGILREEE